MKNYYKISEISKLYGIGTDTVRYYEKVGILKPKRDVNGYRSYNLQDIYKLNVIRDLRELDFSTERIKEYLDFQSLDNTLSLLHEESALLNRQLEELSLRRSAIERRIEVLKVAAAAKDGIFSLKELPPRLASTSPEMKRWILLSRDCTASTKIVFPSWEIWQSALLCQ